MVFVYKILIYSLILKINKHKTYNYYIIIILYKNLGQLKLVSNSY